MVGKRGRSSWGNGMIWQAMKLSYRLASYDASKNFDPVQQNATFLSTARAGDSFSRTKPPALCELPPGLGGRYRPGGGGRGSMGVTRPRGTSSPSSQPNPSLDQSQSQQIGTTTQQNANFLSTARAGDSFSRTKPPALCELPPGLG